MIPGEAANRTLTDPRLLAGPVLVLGAGGFVGANLFLRILRARPDVVGVVRRLPAWRLAEVPTENLAEVDLNNPAEVRQMIDAFRPATILHCAAYGAYSFETDSDLIYQTNFSALRVLIDAARRGPLRAFVHAGSSSEYGRNCAAPLESDQLLPNSDYAVSKAAAAQYICYAGQTLAVPIVNLRLYSAYGPLEDPSRLIPAVVQRGLAKQHPPYVADEISRDFVYVDDLCDAFILAAVRMNPDLYGQSFNIGSGRRTTMRDLAAVAAEAFDIPEPPVFGTMAGRRWDLADWYAAPGQAAALLGWEVRTPLADGLRKMADWVASLGPGGLDALPRKQRKPERRSVAAIIACYKDAQAIPIMHQRLTGVFQKVGVDYEIIFVNDCSPDESADVIRALSASDPHVIGITHSRNFGSQMAFRSGMEMATMDACVLLDGDLQDPPELIDAFVEKWNAGYDVVYGRRVDREMPMIWGLLYKAFYRILAAFSYLEIPKDAGDFSLMDKRVVGWLLRCPERDLFVRGLRAYVGFRQTGVDYKRPERMFGRSTNNLWKNIEWAKRGIFSFSNTPLKVLTAAGGLLLVLSATLAMFTIGVRIFAPGSVMPGVTTVLLSILFFGALNLFAVGIVGEYIAKIMEEVKERPRLIRESLIKDGEVTHLLPEQQFRR
jgi:nucleoside-diphosphate-sugar epimerase/glycosyltransferase involved in cell wall biosynthesis